MAAPGSLPPPLQERSDGGCAHVPVFVDTDLGTHFALNVAADTNIIRLKSQAAMEHAAAFPDIGPVVVKSFQVLRKGAMYHLSDSMTVRSAVFKVKTGCFLHAKITAVEVDTHCRRDKDRGRSSEHSLGFDVDTRASELAPIISEIASDVLPERLEGAEDALFLNSAHAHDAVPNNVHLSYSSQQNAERKQSKAVSLDNDVVISVSVTDKPKSYSHGGRHGDQTRGGNVSSTSVANINIATDKSNLSLVGDEVVIRKEDPHHSFQDNDLDIVSCKKQVGMTEGTAGVVHSLDYLSRKKEHKMARKTGCFDTSAADPVKESKDPETTVAKKSDRIPLEINTNSHRVHSSTSFQQEVHENLQEDSIQVENLIMAGKNKKRKKHQLVPPESVSAQEMTKPLTGAMAALIPIGEDILLQDNQGPNSFQIESPIMSRKNKKRKKRQLVPAESVSAQEMTKPLTGALAALKPIGEDMLHEDNQGPQGDDACNVEITRSEKAMVQRSDILSSSQLNSGRQGTKNVQLVSNVQATTDPVAGQGDINLVHEWYRNPTVGDTSDSTSKVIANEDTFMKGINDGYQCEGAVEASRVEKGSKSNNILETIHAASDTSQDKNCDEANKVGYVGIASMNTTEEKNNSGYGEKAANSDIISTHGEIVNDPYKRRNSSNVQQGDSNVIENAIGDGKRKKKKRQHSEYSEDNPTQIATKSSGFIRIASSTQNTSAHPSDAKQTALGTIGEETVEGKDHCKHGEKAAKPVIASTQGEFVKNPSNVQQWHSDAIKATNGHGKQKKKRGCRSESSKHDPTQDVTISSGYMGEAAVIDCKKVDENLAAETTNVINDVLADLKCTDSITKGMNGDPLGEETHVSRSKNELGILGCLVDKDGINAVIPPKYQAEVYSDAPISSPNHKKSNGEQLKVLSTVLDLSRSSGCVPEEMANTEQRESDSLRCSDSDLKCVLTESIVVPADDNIKSTKRQRKKTSLKHVSRNSGKAIQSSAEEVNQVAPEDLKGANASRAEMVQGGWEINSPARTVQKTPKKSKRSSKNQAPKTQEVNHNQFAKDIHDEYVPDIGGTHSNDKAVETPTKSPVDLKEGTVVTYDSPNAQKGRKKSCNTELQSQHTDLEHGSDVDLMNFGAQQRTIIPNSSADAVEPNDYLAVHHAKDKINFIDHFSPSGTNDSFDSAENSKYETIGGVKSKTKSKRKTMQSQRAGSIEQNDLLQSHLHTEKNSSTDQLAPGNVGVASDLTENNNREDSSLKSTKEKKKRKRGLVKPESQNPNDGHQDMVNCVQKEMNSQNNEKGNDAIFTQNKSILQQKIEDAAFESTLAKKPHQDRVNCVQMEISRQSNGKGNNGKFTQNNSKLQHKIEDAASESTLEKKPHQCIVDAGVQNNLANDKDYAHTRKEQRDSTTQTKHHVSGRTDPNTNAVSNLVNSFSMSPPPSSQSPEGISQNANRQRVAVRKVPRKAHGQVSDKSKKDSSQRGTSTIFSDAISEGSDDVLNTMSKNASMEASSDDSSTSADSGISSAAALYESDVPDDDGAVPLSQRSLRDGLHIGSILRGSTSYKKARRKQAEEFDDNEIPDSLPDSLY